MKNEQAAAAPGRSAAAEDKKDARLTAPIVFCADAHYGLYVSVILQSLLDHASADCDYVICIFDCGLKPANLARLERQIAGRANFSLKIYPLQKYLAENASLFAVKEGQTVSAATYGRLLIPQLCPEYDQIIYADIDMIFTRDPAELLAQDLGGAYIAAAADSNIEGERRARAGIGRYCRTVLGMADDQIYVNAGFLVFNAALWRARGLVGQCLALLRRGQLKRHDQDAINAVCKGRIRFLPAEWNKICKFYGKAAAGEAVPPPALCHFAGALKPWHLLPEQAGELGGIWWHYARRTEAYAELRQGAAACQARLNQNLGARGFYLFGLPLWSAQTTPKKVKYRLLGATVAKTELNIKTGARSFSLLGLRLRRS